VSGHWLSRVEEVLSADTADLRQLAEIAGCDPRTFYVGQDLSECDLAGQDLRCMDLSGSNINISNLDDNTLIDPFFDPRVKLSAQNRYLQIPHVLVSVVRGYRMERGIYTAGSALKEILDLGYVELLSHDEADWRRLVAEFDFFFADLFSTPSVGRKRFTLKVKDIVYHSLFRIGTPFRGRSPGIVLGLVLGFRRAGLVTFADGEVIARGLSATRTTGGGVWQRTVHHWRAPSADGGLLASSSGTGEFVHAG
jgi:hypothetical protein